MTKQARNLCVVVVLAWIFAILFPFCSFRRFSPGYRIAFDWVFHTHASHVLMHTFLYAVLGWLQCALFSRPMRSSGRLCAFVLLNVAIVAGLQEAIQMICEHVPLGGDEVFDFFVDLNGGILGTMLFVWMTRRRIMSREKPFTRGTGLSVEETTKDAASKKQMRNQTISALSVFGRAAASGRAVCIFPDGGAGTPPPYPDQPVPFISVSLTHNPAPRVSRYTEDICMCSHGSASRVRSGFHTKEKFR